MKGKKTGGRVKGSVNKMPTIREHFERVFHELQADAEHNLAAWAKKNPSDYYKLAHRLIPQSMDVTGHVTYGELVREATQHAKPELKVINGGKA